MGSAPNSVSTTPRYLTAASAVSGKTKNMQYNSTKTNRTTHSGSNSNVCALTTATKNGWFGQNQ